MERGILKPYSFSQSIYYWKNSFLSVKLCKTCWHNVGTQMLWQITFFISSVFYLHNWTIVGRFFQFAFSSRLEIIANTWQTAAFSRKIWTLFQMKVYHHQTTTTQKTQSIVCYNLLRSEYSYLTKCLLS